MWLIDAMRGAEQELSLSLRVLVRMARPCLAHMTPGLGVKPAARRGRRERIGKRGGSRVKEGVEVLDLVKHLLIR
jgi:hypothetical protein